MHMVVFKQTQHQPQDVCPLPSSSSATHNPQVACQYWYVEYCAIKFRVAFMKELVLFLWYTVTESYMNLKRVEHAEYKTRFICCGFEDFKYLL